LRMRTEDMGAGARLCGEADTGFKSGRGGGIMVEEEEEEEVEAGRACHQRTNYSAFMPKKKNITYQISVSSVASSCYIIVLRGCAAVALRGS
jgi:hypothetical protein